MARRPPPPLEPIDVELEEELLAVRRDDDDAGSPGRMIAIMVGIVGILLLGSLFWSAVGALFGALGAATEAVPLGRSSPGLQLAAEPTSVPAATATVLPVRATAAPTLAPTTVPTAQPEPSATPAAEDGGRAPWVLLPQPAPGSTVTPGQITVEARGRGDAAIAEIRLELDGAPIGTTLDQRSDSIWRGGGTARVGAGQHSVKATVIDERGRTGSYRWTFEARP